MRGLVIFSILQKEMSEVLAFFFRSLEIQRLLLAESLLLGISPLFTGEKRWCFPNPVYYVPCFTLGPCIGDRVPPKCRLLRRLSSPHFSSTLPRLRATAKPIIVLIYASMRLRINYILHKAVFLCRSTNQQVQNARGVSGLLSFNSQETIPFCRSKYLHFYVSAHALLSPLLCGSVVR